MNAKNFGLAAGIVFGLMMFALTVVCMMTGYGKPWLDLVATVYVGYTATWMGCVIGFLYGFAEGFISFYLIGFIYNKLNH